MPSYAFNQLVDLEEMMCKQLLSLDLREPSRPLQSLSLAMRTPGYTGQPRNEALFSSSSSTSSFFSSSSHLSADPSDAAYLSSCQWGQQSDSSLPSLPPNSTRWGKPGFWAERSVSMVETSSSAANTLGWPVTETKRSQTPTCPTLLSASSLPSSASSLLSSSSSSASAPSSSRYKTELCRTFAESGICKYGNKCQFAHGPDELRDLNRHPKYKTEPCRTFHTIGFCPYGIRCHFVHNNEEEETHSSFSRSSSFSSSGAPPPPPLPPSSSRPRRPPLLRQSFSFAGFPSAPPQPLRPSLPPPPFPPSFLRPPSASPPPLACADIADLLSHTFLEMDSAFEASPGPQLATVQAPPVDPRAQFLPSPDSGCSLSGLSPASSPSGQSPGSTRAFAGPLGARSLSHTSLSDADQDGSGGSSASSLSGSESCSGVTESNGRRLAVFSQLSVPEDVTSFFL